MKPNSPAQLARLLDQLHAAYPHGIPLEVIKAPIPEATGVTGEPDAAFLLVAVSADEALSPAEDELLESIATKGLKLAKDAFTKLVVPDVAAAGAALAGGASVVIVFGGYEQRGFIEREGGGRALMTFGVKDLLADAAHKKELWRELQKLL